MVKDNIAIILARGGSKRIPRKNIIDFQGKPLLAWTVDAALNSKCFEKVLVSTDDTDIADIAIKSGAEVPFLRHSAADDQTPSSEATLLALDQAENFWGRTFSTVTQLMPNCPLRTAEDIVDALRNYYENEADSQLSCFKFGWMNPWWATKLSDDQRPEFVFPDAIKARSQDLEDLYCPTGAIWIAKTEALRKNRTFYTPDHKMHPLHWASAIDIDDYSDMEMANACFALRREN